MTDQIGTLYHIILPNVKLFVKSKVKIYGDSILLMSKSLTTKFLRLFTSEDVIDVLINVKIERLKYGFSHNLDYTDSMCDLLSYTWIKNNFNDYLEIVENLKKK